MSQGHIRPQGEGSWEIKFDLGRNPLTGRRTTKYVTFRGTKRKAQEDVRYWPSVDINGEAYLLSLPAARLRERLLSPSYGRVKVDRVSNTPLSPMKLSAFAGRLMRR
jgi:hypothetical protein